MQLLIALVLGPDRGCHRSLTHSSACSVPGLTAVMCVKVLPFSGPPLAEPQLRVECHKPVTEGLQEHRYTTRCGDSDLISIADQALEPKARQTTLEHSLEGCDYHLS